MNAEDITALIHACENRRDLIEQLEEWQAANQKFKPLAVCIAVAQTVDRLKEEEARFMRAARAGKVSRDW